MSEMERDRENEGSGGIRLDLSLNIPTILMMTTMLVSSVLYLNTRFGELQTQNAQVDTRLTNVEKRQDNFDTAITIVRTEASASNSALRQDVRADIRDVKNSVDTLTATLNSRGR